MELAEAIEAKGSHAAQSRTQHIYRVLRLIAVAGIAIFHTFQGTFQATRAGVVEYTSLAAFPIPDVSLHAHYWCTQGLEFIWVYAATV